jgi:peptidoglycan hydrolase-like protein with peptidoglycan-binding domain
MIISHYFPTDGNVPQHPLSGDKIRLSHMKCAFVAALLGISLTALATPQTAQITTAKSAKATTAKTSVKSSGAHRRASRRLPPHPSYQLHPDAERYRQIQQALAERGYFKGQVNGDWGDDSVEALKRFQADQKLEDDGKINALTLIGLGLGPKHESASVTSGAMPSSNSAAAPHADSSDAPSPAPAAAGAAPTPASGDPPR